MILQLWMDTYTQLQSLVDVHTFVRNNLMELVEMASDYWRQIEGICFRNLGSGILSKQELGLQFTQALQCCFHT